MATIAVATTLTTAKELSEAPSNILISCVGGLLETEEIGSIVSASPTELRHLLLEICGDAGEAENLVRELLKVLGVLHQSR